jgi:hypothetical protein
MAAIDGKAQAYAECADVCRRLRERGDELSIEAAAHVEGTNQAFADLVDEREKQREEVENLRRNLENIYRLWGRVPQDVRIATVHGKPVAN